MSKQRIISALSRYSDAQKELSEAFEEFFGFEFADHFLTAVPEIEKAVAEKSKTRVYGDA